MKFLIKFLLVTFFFALPGYVALKFLVFKGELIQIVAVLFCVITSYIGYSFIFRERKREKQYKQRHNINNQDLEDDLNSSENQETNNYNPNSGAF
ncbi:hypothetical protein WKH56_09135 [Priestia sp. SB1]|uniref:hypothetical protein n=1 Tax=Priestia sp. SB1 TaxID=3132359 RepID=UPI00317FDA60